MVFYNETSFWIGIVSILVIVFILLSLTFYFKNRKKRKRKIAKLIKEEIKSEKKVISQDVNIPEYTLDQKLIKESDLKNNKFYTEVSPYDYLHTVKYVRRTFLPFLWKIVTVRHKLARKLNKKPEKYVKVRFKLLNDKVKEFPVIASHVGFMFNKGKYLFDEGAKYETIQGGEIIPTYDFHEALVLPVKVRLRMHKEIIDYLDQNELKFKKKGMKISDIKDNLKLDSKLLDYLKNYEEVFKKPLEGDIKVDEVKDVLESEGVSEVQNIVNPITLHRYLQSDFIQQLVKSTLAKLVKIMFWVVLIIGLIAIIILILNIVIIFQITGGFEKLVG